MARLLHHGSREGVELIQADAQEQERPGDAIADLRAAGKRLGDLDLTAIIRRVRWQFDRHVQRSAAAEAQAARSAAQVDVLTRQRDLIGRQRDEAVAQVRQLQRSGPDARLERLSAEFKRAMAERNNAVRERDEVRAVLERLRKEVANGKTAFGRNPKLRRRKRMKSKMRFWRHIRVGGVVPYPPRPPRFLALRFRRSNAVPVLDKTVRLWLFLPNPSKR
jgi:hypothetical protein